MNKNPIVSKKQSGLTLVELMVVIAIISILAGIAVPSIFRGRQQAQIAALGDEFRTDYEAFTMFAQEKGQLPLTPAGFSMVPTGMDLYMPKKTTWLIDNASGSLTNPQFRGRWYWFGTQVPAYPGFNGFIMFYSPDITPEVAQIIDARLDDGNVSTGALRYGTGAGGNWLYFGIQ
jgi:prepilin-type N-terminal cleavage/methylation domain-containing protein